MDGTNKLSIYFSGISRNAIFLLISNGIMSGEMMQEGLHDVNLGTIFHAN